MDHFRSVAAPSFSEEEDGEEEEEEKEEEEEEDAPEKPSFIINKC